MDLSQQSMGLDRDIFLRNLIRELSGTLESVVGLDEAAGFISIVGQHIGDWMNEEYKKLYKTEELSPEQIRDVLIDLKARIQGDFYLLEEDEEKIILGNRHCPFGDRVIDRPSMCMMTSNVFGTISSEHLGYSKVCMHETIAQGHPECRVVVYKNDTEAARLDDGREYYKSG